MSRRMLRFDRYLVADRRAIDLASGQLVDLERTRGGMPPTLFHTRGGRTLIDLEAADDHRIEVWEHWRARGQPRDLAERTVAFVELLDTARLGAPRAFDAPAPNPRHGEYLRRVLAREARLRGWVPLALALLGTWFVEQRRALPPWLRDRSLVVFVDASPVTRQAALALWHLARRDARPHVLVRSLTRVAADGWWSSGRRTPPVVHELSLAPASAADDVPPPTSAEREAQARWTVLLEATLGRRRSASRMLELAEALAAREQPFEARAVLARLPPGDAATTAGRVQLEARLHQQARSRAAKGWEMVDDVVDVLEMCRDIEDEQVALARLGAFLHRRLQAASVAFVVREGRASRVLARIGSPAAGVDLALRTMETGMAVAPSHLEGPAESACPVRHAAEVIGALWCRWGAGMPIAAEQAATLLGVAAAAAAPSVRLAISRQPPAARASAVPELVGESSAIDQVRQAIMRAAASPFPVVIEGESGSGKELAARAIHTRSPRRDRRFCALNCAALVDELVEAELFGHTRGAFTGAHADRAGIFEDASGGTLFLDEVAELTARVQAKLLRTLQEGEVRRVGESTIRKIDARIVAATNRPLARAVADGAFRADLWYRLDVIRITMPPLRDRLEDLPVLVAHLWQRLAERTGSRAVLAPATLAALAAYAWPGNIRELQNVLASLMVSAPRTGWVTAAALPAHVARAAALERGATLADARRQFDERYVRAALARAGGRTGPAARSLGLSRQGLSKLMGRLNIH